MAMAEVFIPDLAGSDDHLNGGYPRAPPPSPEIQPRNHGRVFEIPASKFEGIGIGLDLRRNTFPLDDDDDESPLGTCHHQGAVAMGYNIEHTDWESPSVHLRDFDDEDNSLPGSPQKKVCSSPCTLPNEFVTTAFPSSSNEDSLVSSGFGSYQLPPLHISTGDLGGFHSNPGSLSGSGSPYIHSSRLGIQTSPQFVAGATQESDNIMMTHVPYPMTTPSHHDDALLSRSYDLHSMHPHLPRSFETTQLPEVRPSRSRTLDSTLHHPLIPEPDALGTHDDLNQRRRKISIKRKNPEDEEDSNLQFSFEYSYSSTGSSGEADWVMVDCKMEPSWPTGKKACCADDPSSVAISHQKELRTSPLHGTPISFPSSGVSGRVGLFSSSATSSAGSTISTGLSPFAAVTTSPFMGQQVGVSFDRVVTPTNHHANLESMECEGMECDQTSSSAYDRENNRGSLVFGGVDVTSSGRAVSFNAPLLGVEEGVAVMRPHHSLGPAPSAVLRHSCMDEYLQVHKGQGWGNGGADSGLDTGLNGDLDAARLNLSKSL